MNPNYSEDCFKPLAKQGLCFTWEISNLFTKTKRRVQCRQKEFVSHLDSSVNSIGLPAVSRLVLETQCQLSATFWLVLFNSHFGISSAFFKRFSQFLTSILWGVSDEKSFHVCPRMFPLLLQFKAASWRGVLYSWRQGGTLQLVMSGGNHKSLHEPQLWPWLNDQAWFVKHLKFACQENVLRFGQVLKHCWSNLLVTKCCQA